MQSFLRMASIGCQGGNIESQGGAAAYDSEGAGAFQILHSLKRNHVTGMRSRGSMFDMWCNENMPHTSWYRIRVHLVKVAPPSLAGNLLPPLSLSLFSLSLSLFSLSLGISVLFIYWICLSLSLFKFKWLHMLYSMYLACIATTQLPTHLPCPRESRQRCRYVHYYKADEALDLRTFL